jgi:hypothetical protein
MLSADATRIALMERTFGEGAPPARAAVADLPRAENGTLRAPEPTDFTSVPTAATVPGTGGTYNLFRHEEVVLSADGLHAIVVAQYLRPFGDGLFDRLTAVFGYRLADGASTRLDLGAAGTPIGNRDRSLAGVAVSGNGRRVAFAEENAPGQPASVVHAVDRDPDEDGAYGPDGGEPILSQVASRNTASVVVGGRSPAFSADGRYFAFATDAGGTHNGVDDTIRFESCIRRPPPILTINSYTAAELAAGPAAPGRAQPAPRGLAATHGPTHGPTQSPAPVPSSSSSSAPPVQTGTSYCDIAVRDLVVDRQREAANQPRLPAELASPSLRTACRAFTPGATCEGNGESDDPVLTADGSAVAFASAATDLVEGDTNSRRDVFVRRFLPELRADPLNFGAVQLDNATNRTAEIGHVGFGPLGIASVAITGPNAADFEVFPAETCTGAVLHASLQCLVSVRFRPREVGERSAVLEVRPRGGGAPLRVPLVGSGTERPISGNGFRAEPNPLDFGERRVLSTSDARAVTVTNAGTAPLRISSVRFEAAGANSFPGDYRIVANTCLAGNAPLVIPRGGTCQVTLSHNPQGSGSRPAVLVFDDPIGAPFPQMVAVRGGGAQPVLTASPPLARPGQVSQVKGSNFPANQSVTVKLDGMPGEIRCRSNSDGELVDADNRLWVALVVLPGTTPGGKDLRATVTSGLTPPNTVEAKVRYVVVPGSGTPRERDSTLRLRR